MTPDLSRYRTLHALNLALAVALLPLVGTWWLSRRIRRRIEEWEAGQGSEVM